jgi:hypothetical protein
MEVVVLTEMSRTGQIIQMWQSTGAWDRLKEQKRQAIVASLKQVMQATNNDYNIVLWMARCIQRGLLLAINKSSRIKQMLNDENPTNRVYNDFNFFVGNNAGAFVQMYKDILQTAEEMQNDPVFADVPDIRNGKQQLNADGTPKMRREKVDLIKLLNNVKYTKDQNGRQIDRSAADVYDDINSVMKVVGDAAKLPKGERIVEIDENSHWSFVDAEKCKIEGSMMGHCGNAAAKQGDAIISLRIKAMLFFEPRATFIYNKNTNTFGEMKGRHNKKPSEYHKEIVALLSKPTYDLPDGKQYKLQYLQGSGYAYDFNFSLNDLSEPLFKQLCRANGDLIMRQIKNASKVSTEQKLDDQRVKWANEIINGGTIKYMQDQ